MPGPSQEEHIREYINTTRQHFAIYHNHKEQMAFVIAALYLTGVSALIVQKDPAWATIFSSCITNILATIFSAFAFSFVWWQLSKRSFAENIVSSCDRLRVKWLESPPQSPKVSYVAYKNMAMPKCLKDEIDSVTPSKSTFTPTILTLTAIFGWYVMLIIRIQLIVKP